MKEWLRKLFSENSDVSWTRVAGSVCVLSAVGIAAYSLTKTCNLDNGSVLTITAFLTAAFGAKVGQKIVEAKKRIKKDE